MTNQEHHLDRIFQALSDSTRRQILLRIKKEDKAVTDIAEKFDISLPAISKHLKVLEKAGLISRVKVGQKRLCHAEPNIVEEAHAWLEFYQSFWNDRLDHFKSYIEQDN